MRNLNLKYIGEKFLVDENNNIFINEEDDMLSEIEVEKRAWPQLHSKNINGKEKIIIYDPKSDIKFTEVRCIDRNFRTFISIDNEVKCLECDRSFGKLNDGLSNERLKKHLCKWRSF